MRLISRSHLYYVSPWLLAAATALLVLIIVTFAVSNLQREKKQMTNSMLQKAVTIMRLVNSSSRASYMANLRDDAWSISPWNDHVQKVIDQVAEDPDVHYLTVLDHKGKVIAHSKKQFIGSIIGFQAPAQPMESKEQDRLLAHRIVVDSNHEKIFEVVRSYIPYRSHMERMLADPWMSMRHSYAMFGRNHFVQQHAYQSPDTPDPALPYYLVVGLDMRDFDRSLIRLKLQVFVLSVTMLLVGLGGWFSLAAVQGYRISQQTLSEIKAFTGHLIAKLPVGIIATNRKGRITTWNKVVAELTGLDSKQTTGRLPKDVLPRKLHEFFIEKQGVGYINPDEKGQKKEIVISIAKQEYMLFCHLIDILDYESVYLGQVLLITNMTEIKRMEKEMRENERLAAVGRMAAGVAHEVRNPLSSIKGLALLLKDKFARQSRENKTAELLIQEVERMNRTISELLSFARPASLKLQHVDMGDMLQEELRLIEPDAKSNNIVTTLTVDDDLAKVDADPDRLKQVFINILLNAVQAMDMGGTLEVTVINSASRDSVKVLISDNGKGIEDLILNQIFYPYFTTKQGGTGIGLAISQKIIADHQGSIKIDSVYGQGTTVTVSLPTSQQ